MTLPAPEDVSEDPRSSASRDGFAKLSLIDQTACETAEAVSDDLRSSACQDAFEKVLSVIVKNLVLRIEAALMQRRVQEFQQPCNGGVPYQGEGNQGNRMLYFIVIKSEV
jgi:predicted cobalt transporter CbtA